MRLGEPGIQTSGFPITTNHQPLCLLSNSRPDVSSSASSRTKLSPIKWNISKIKWHITDITLWLCVTQSRKTLLLPIKIIYSSFSMICIISGKKKICRCAFLVYTCATIWPPDNHEIQPRDAVQGAERLHSLSSPAGSSFARINVS